MRILRKETIRQIALTVVNEIEEDITSVEGLCEAWEELGEGIKSLILEKWVGVIIFRTLKS